MDSAAPAGWLDEATRLICQHIPREHRGEIWLRARNRPLNRSLLWTIERNRRIDEWRKRTRARAALPVRLSSIDNPDDSVIREIGSHAPERTEAFPTDFVLRLLECCDARERMLAWCLIVDDMAQQDVARLLGLTQARVSQLFRGLRAKLWRQVEQLWPGLAEEMR